MQEHRLDINGHQIAAYEYNADIKSIPLIFIHGITGNIGFWEGVQIPLVKERFHWFSLSLLGHYPSTFPENFKREDMTNEAISELMAEAIRQLTKGKPAILVGHSTGGFSALAVANCTPELVHSIVLIDAFVLGRWYGSFIPAQFLAKLGKVPFTLYFKSFLFSLASFRFAYLLIARDFAAAWASEAFQASAKATYPFSKKMDISGMWIYFNRMPQLDIRESLPKIQHSVKILHGTRDWIIPPAHAEEMQKLLPHSTLTWIEGSGHLPMFERQADYEAALTKAIEDVIGAGIETRASA